MCPQPLSRVRSDATAFWGPHAFIERPVHAVSVVRTIAHWAEVEAILGTVLTNMLSAHAGPVAAVYSRINGNVARNAAIEGAASVVFSGLRLDFFNAALVAIRKLGSKRNDFAHWLWGYSPEIPDGLLLLDPKDEIQHKAKPKGIEAFGRAFLENKHLPFEDLTVKLHKVMDVEPALVQVYALQELESIYADVDKAYVYSVMLETFVEVPNMPDDHIRSLLHRVPEIRTVLDKRHKGRRPPP